MKAYVQIDTKGGNNKEIVCEGLKALDIEVIECHRYHQLKELSKDYLFYGGVGFIRSICEQYNYIYKPIGEVPKEMEPYAGRKMFECTVEEALRISETKKLFVKPTAENNKGFSGRVISNSLDDAYLLNYYLRPTDKVLASEVVKFVSEWRCFVVGYTICEMVHYKGDKDILPTRSIANKAAYDWRYNLIAYALDIGVTADGDTLVVECNDLPSLGLYGVKPVRFGEMLITRWQEIHKNGGINF